MNYPRLVIAGTHSGLGKTTVTLGSFQGGKAHLDSVDTIENNEAT